MEQSRPLDDNIGVGVNLKIIKSPEDTKQFFILADKSQQISIP